MNPLWYIRKNPLLGAGEDKRLQALADRSDVRLFDSEDVVCRAGAQQREVLLIADGRVELYRRNKEAKTQILVGLLRAPAVFGDAEFYAGTTWSVSARAVEPTIIVAMPNDDFDALVQNDVRVAAGLYRDSCARHMLVIQIMEILALQRTQHQILRLLWGLSEMIAETGERVAPLSQARLSRALGLNRKTIARQLKELEERGLIRRDGTNVVLLLPEDLPLWRDLEDHGLGASWQLS